MRDIRDIISELRQHPDFVGADILTVDDIIYDLNCQLLDGINEDDEFVEIDYDTLTEKDKDQIIDHVERVFENLWNDQTPFPYWEELQDLSKKLERDSKISRILEK